MSIYDHFNDGSISADFGTSVNGSATITEFGTYLTINTTHAASDAGIVYFGTKVDKTQSRFYAHKVRALDFEVGANAFLLAVYNSAVGTPMVADNVTFNGNLRFYCYQNSTAGIYIIYFDNAGTPHWWDGTTKSWSGVSAVAHAGVVNTFYVLQFVHDATSCRMVLLEGSGCKELQHTDSVAWADLKGPSADLYILWGEAYTNFYYCDLVSDWFRYGDEAEIVAFYNGQTGLEYCCGRCVSYNNGLDFVRSPKTAVITKVMFQVGENVSDVKDIYTLPDGGVLYALCSHLNSVTGKWSISCFTSVDNGVTMVRSGTAAKITPGGVGAPDENGCRFPILAKDTDTSEYKIYYGGDSVAGGSSLCLATATDLTVTSYTKYGLNPVLSKGVVGTFEDGGLYATDVVFDGTVVRIYYGGLRLATGKWEIGEATTSNWTTLTKDVRNPIVQRLSTLLTSLIVNNSVSATVGDSSIFHVGEVVILDNTGALYQANRIETIDSPTTLTLSYPANGNYAAGSLLKSLYQGSLFPAEVRKSGAVWQMWLTPFQISATLEMTGYATGTAHDTWTLDKINVLRLPLGCVWDTVSAENMRFIGNGLISFITTRVYKNNFKQLRRKYVI